MDHAPSLLKFLFAILKSAITLFADFNRRGNNTERNSLEQCQFSTKNFTSLQRRRMVSRMHTVAVYIASFLLFIGRVTKVNEHRIDKR